MTAELCVFSWQDIDRLVTKLAQQIDVESFRHTGVWGVPTGGAFVAQAISQKTGIPLLDCLRDGCLVVDDLIDSGDTLQRYSGFRQAALVRKPHSPSPNVSTADTVDGWIVFPWEVNHPKQDDGAGQCITRLLQFIGEDVKRDGLQETPKRASKFWSQWVTKGNPDFNLTSFDGEGADQMIVQRNINFYSMCEHHLLPFFGDATVAYIPRSKIVGLSKLARLVEHFSRRPQNQERITKQVAEALHDTVNPLGVAVVLKARHLCMEMRGVKARGAETITSHLTGVFRDDMKAREELLQLTKL